MDMESCPSQLHVNLNTLDHHKLSRIAERREVSLSEAIRQLIRDAQLGKAKPRARNT